MAKMEPRRRVGSPWFELHDKNSRFNRLLLAQFGQLPQIVKFILQKKEQDQVQKYILKSKDMRFVIETKEGIFLIQLKSKTKHLKVSLLISKLWDQIVFAIHPNQSSRMRLYSHATLVFVVLISLIYKRKISLSIKNISEGQ